MLLYSVEVARPGRSINTGTQKSPLVRQHERAWCGKPKASPARISDSLPVRFSCFGLRLFLDNYPRPQADLKSTQTKS
jgi:hypothetical protein